MAELRFLKELGYDRRLVGGLRIQDDITVVVGITDETEDEGYQEQLFKRFEKIYYRHLEIVRKDDCGFTWDFMGSHMIVSSRPLLLHYTPVSKNTESLNNEGRLIFQTMQDYESYSAKAVKKAVLTATLKRVWDHTLSKQLVLGAMGFAICEADLRGYPPEVSLGALVNLTKAVPTQALRTLLSAMRVSADWVKGIRRERGTDQATDR
ncbi:hypothetical protein CBR_g3857 [Chara braunii]|uniref:Uncharacterized protein n=1 Tax=Chara braunii TaxID=69332 RepID=A0A388KGN4_CHABU|nr:hypothetical protein CBR_g3857 [Chara braunii]|eukprot:GBG69157.1 hypothetical protein CBR_g3857 [Chara braunii]